MANGAVSETVLDGSLVMGRRPPESLAADAWRRFRRNRLAVIGLLIVAVIVTAAVLASVITIAIVVTRPTPPPTLVLDPGGRVDRRAGDDAAGRAREGRKRQKAASGPSMKLVQMCHLDSTRPGPHR